MKNPPANQDWQYDSCPSKEEILERFDYLKKRWIAETRILSNPRLKYNNENYQEIIKLDSYILPYLIDDLRENDYDWFFALREITNDDPIKKGHEGYYDLMKQDWLDWAEKYKVNQYASNDFRYAGSLDPAKKVNMK